MRDQLQVTRTHSERHARSLLFSLLLSLTTNSPWTKCTAVNSKDLSPPLLPLSPSMAYKTSQKHLTVTSKSV